MDGAPGAKRAILPEPRGRGHCAAPPRDQTRSRL